MYTFLGWLAPCAALLPLAAPLGASGSEASDDVVVLRAERVIVRPGTVLENALVVVRNGKIAAVGTDLNVPSGAREITGKLVCAGFLDAWSALGVAGDAARDASSTSATRALDGLDVHNADHLRREALRAGITSLRLQVGERSRVGGLGAIVRVLPGTDREAATVLADSNLWVTLGLSPQGQVIDFGGEGGARVLDPFDRIDALDRLTALLQAGRSYLVSKNEHKHELIEWEKKTRESEAELEKEFKKAKKDREKEEKDAKEKGKEFKEKKYKEDKKPSAPRFDEDNEVVARVVDGELPLIVHANRAAEIRGLLLATREMPRLRWILAGGAEALPYAAELAAREVPVLVWPAPLGLNRPDELEELDITLAARLAHAGVEVLLGSGGSEAAATRDLPLLAALAIGSGLAPEKAFEALTLGAARALDVAHRLGSVEAGKDADLLVLDGEPLGAATRVRYVLVAGRVLVTPED